MNPFQQMAGVLIKHPAFPVASPDAQNSGEGQTRTETIRQLLRSATRPVTAAEIAFDMENFPNFGSHLVWLLLKYDIQKGRVILEDGKYRWNHEYETKEAKQLRAAIKLLKKHGYIVNEPEAKP